MSYNNDYLSALNEAADLPAIVASLYPESGLEYRAGKDNYTVKAVWRGEYFPSFSIFKNLDRSCWCYSDKATSAFGRTEGNAYQFLTEIHNMEHQDAIDYLQAQTGVTDSNFKSTYKKKVDDTPKDLPHGEMIGSETIDYMREHVITNQIPKALEGRGFTLDDAKYNRYGATDSGDVLIPIFNPECKVIAIKGRRPKGFNGERYYYLTKGLSSPPKCNREFGSPNDNTKLYIIEGELNADILDSVCREFGSKLSIIGLAGNKTGLYESVARGKDVYLYLDSTHSDSFKERTVALLAQKRIFKILKRQGARKIYVLHSLTKKDFCDVANESRQQLWKTWNELLDGAEEMDFRKHPLWDLTLRDITELKNDSLDGKVVYPSGFPDIDNMTGGYSKHGVTLICALSGQGKSTFIRQSLYNLSKNVGMPCKVYSTEESVQNFIIGMTDLMTGIPITSINLPYEKAIVKKNGGRDAVLELWEQNFHYYTSYFYRELAVVRMNRLNQILEDIERSYERGQYGFFCVDFIQAVTDDKNSLDPDSAAAQLADKAAELNIPVVIGCQLAKIKFPYDRTSGIPVFSDIEGRGIIYQRCDNAWFLYTQDIYMRNQGYQSPADYRAYTSDDIGKTRFIPHKNRGRTDLVTKYLLWDKEAQKLESMLK